MDIVEINTIDELLSTVREYIKDKKELDTIRKAYDYASKVHKNDIRKSGEDYMHHPLNVAYILTDLYADSDTLSAALLHDTIHIGNASLEDIEKEFGTDISFLVKGITKINKLNLFTDSENQINYYKKIIIGLTEDVRIIIIKLAERCQNMRTLYVLKEESRKRKAKETIELLVPIAHRLGLSKIKSELEVNSLKYYKPNAFVSVEELLDNTEEERRELVNEMKRKLSDLLIENNISNFEIKGRAKSIYSIYRKLQKGKKFSEIYDIYALRIIVNTESECYQVLGIVHSKFKPKQNRFKDYIANPKTNMYQSLHTTVFGHDGKLYEIQIRTHEMDEVAEKGIASHWSYKEKGKKLQNSMEQKLQLFRSIMELNDDKISSEEFVNTIKNEVLEDSIYVYTPKGDVFELPKGSTPIDFAFKVHTKIGETMVGALVNDNIVPLSSVLHDGDIIKINTNKTSTPSKTWLKYAKTSQAKNKIKSYFSKVDKTESYNKGKDLFQKEIRRRKLPINDVTSKIENILRELKIQDENELYIGMGTGKYSPLTVVDLAFKDDELNKEDFLLEKIEKYKDTVIDIKNDILVDGIDEIKVTLASCCHPIKGDDIVGYISRGNGIVVHNAKCHNINDVQERIISVKWNDNIDKKFKTVINILGVKKDSLLLDIIGKTSGSGITIVKVNTISKPDNNIYELTIEVKDLELLQKYISDLKQNKDILKIERVFN
ncbi:MAG: bifunctional (p)ppGpp synthetase/guanosine-3',5'-bis(diphosphate) 3'-pyrophosphohydrolase [Bacilli bacterium]|nr:bifunctional (p)ppGpp synthetase/guanosine-3',5'-bis(diphosphate) 3'-pyrophosphohydrolase [Bacilli bacterium]